MDNWTKEQIRFENVCSRITAEERTLNGIGTLKEKTLHKCLKNYYDADKEHQEIPVDGYVADIYSKDGIIEIQTAHMGKMRDKLEVFLNNYKVTVVYPIACKKQIIWIDKKTGELVEKRYSPKHGNVYDAFYELYNIRDYLVRPNIEVDIVLMDIEEYRLLDTGKRTKRHNQERYDRIPIKLIDIVKLSQPLDYMQFIPYELKETFTRKEFAKEAGIHADTAWSCLKLLTELDLVESAGKRGRELLYNICPKNC